MDTKRGEKIIIPTTQENTATQTVIDNFKSLKYKMSKNKSPDNITNDEQGQQGHHNLRDSTDLIKSLLEISEQEFKDIGQTTSEANNIQKIGIPDSERDFLENTNKTYYTDEKILYVKEFALRSGLRLLNWEPKMVGNAPVFLGKLGGNYYILLGEDFIGIDIDKLFCIDSNHDTIQNVGGKPFIITQKNEKFLIIRGNETINIDGELGILRDKQYNPLFEFANIPIFSIKKEDKEHLNIGGKLYDKQAFDVILYGEIIGDFLIIHGKQGEQEKILKFCRS